MAAFCSYFSMHTNKKLMINSVNKIFKFTWFILLLLSAGLHAQLANFTITLTGTPETCPNNGSLTWTTANTTANSTVIYTIYNTANLSQAINTTSSTTLTGLPKGTYKVVATQTLGTQSNQATSGNYSIANQKNILTAVSTTLISDEICGSDGSFNISTTGGKSPFQYQLLDASNNVLLAQSSNIFSGLAAGTYKYRVIDACGIGVVGSQSIAYNPSNFTNVNLIGNYTSDCS